ncbi:MAG: TlpA family protein disulfide reductase [Chitinophagaceae bacterium]
MKQISIAVAVLILSRPLYAADIKLMISGAPSDTLNIFWIMDEATRQIKKETLLLHANKAQWEVQPTGPSVVRFSDGKNFIYAILEPGDDVTISYKADDFIGSFQVTGQGAEKYFPDIRKPVSARIKQLTESGTKENLESCWRSINLLETKLLDSVTECHTSTRVQNLVKGYYRSVFNNAKRRLLARLYPGETLLSLSEQRNLSTSLRREFIQLLQFDELLYESPEYLNDVYYALLQEYMSLQLARKVPGDIPDKYGFYDRYLPTPKLRERILCMLAETDFMSLSDTGFLTEWLKKELPPMDSLYATYLQELAARYGHLFRKGEKAPEFTLTDPSGNIFRLSELAGQVVVLDFWYRNCAPCISLFQQFAPLKDSLAGEPVVFLNVSIDDRSQWLQALSQFKIKGRHVYTQDLKDSHPIIRDYQVKGYPTLCIIDKKGNIFNASPPLGNSDAFLKQVRAALAQP